METKITLPEDVKVKRVLGLWDLFAIGYGDLGSSIYYALGVTALFAMGATPLSLGIAGIVFVCTALSYAELTSMYHESGGSASFARHAFNDLISFIAGWALLLDYIVTIAISVFTLVSYLTVFMPILQNDLAHSLFAIGSIAVLYTVNVFGIKRSTRMSIWLAFAAIITQLAIIILGAIFALDIPSVIEHMKIGGEGNPSVTDFMHGTVMAMVAYTGIESIAQLGSEVKKPSRNLPKAIFLNVVALGVLYMGISVVGLSVISPRDLATTYVNNPILGIVSAFPFGGAWLGKWVGLLAAMLLFVAANAGLVGSSRIAYNMGGYYQLPQFLSSVHPKFRTPHLSLLLFSVLAILIIILSGGHLAFLADLYNFGAMLAFFLTNLSLLVLRIKKSDQIRPFKIGFNLSIRGYKLPISAVVGSFATFFVWVLVVLTKPAGRYLGFAWLLLGVVLFVAYRRQKGLTTKGSLLIERVKIPLQASLNIKHILVPIQSEKEAETLQLACEMAKMHKASLCVVHILEVPLSVPLDGFIDGRAKKGTLLLQKAEALARRNDIPIETTMLRGRSFEDTLFTQAEEHKYDLLLIDSTYRVSSIRTKKGPCRVWLCYNG